MKFIGIDFGTSNTLATHFTSDKIEFVRFPDQNISNPTIIYFPEKSKKVEIGTAAVEKYLTDLEENEEFGRLMLSIKSLLPDEKFDHTIVIGHGKQTASGLAAKFIKAVKDLAQEQFGFQFEGVVMGRPVDFSPLAISRLEEAARSAGFKEVVFWLEPVAAALDYERQSERDELICVVDIGGGTSDICIIETSPKRVNEPNRIQDIKAITGFNLAGDAFSSEIMKHRLARRFGDGSNFTSLGKTLPFPIHIIKTLNKWHRIHQLNSSNTLPDLLSIMVSSDHPDDVDRLIKLIRNNYGYELFRSIDQAKKDLTFNNRTQVRFRPLELNEEISVQEFEAFIKPIINKIESSIIQCLNLASVKPSEINQVLLTGGSSQVPLMNRTISEMFGEGKIRRPDFFSSIATGLGYVAQRLNSSV